MRVPLPSFFPSLPPLEEPIRAELFGIERLEQHAESLAAAQGVAAGKEPQRLLLPRVNENGRVLHAANRVIAEAVGSEQWITPAAEWLIDNFFVVDEQLREIRDHLPVGYYRELPALADGPLAGYPRVYGIAWAFVAHTDSRFDPDTLRRFIHAYQRVQPLKIGELWAVTISLRIVLVENLRRLADAIVGGREVRRQADALADEILGVGERGVQSIAAVMRRSDSPRLVTAFAVELLQRLRDRDPAVTPALAWLHQRLVARGTTADEITLMEHQRQAALTVTVRNIITSMRLISVLDWSVFFEDVSLVDETLRAGSNFATMDFVSRDSYRHAIEALAHGSGRNELDVAHQALARAGQESDPRHADPGFHLVGGGRLAFERAIGFRPPMGLRVRRALMSAAFPEYVGALLALTAAILTVPVLMASDAGVSAVGAMVLAALALIPASDLAVALLNRYVTSVAAPALLPRLEFRDGVPEEFRTLVAVPTMLTGPADADEQIGRLEVHYLANADDDVRFALVSDWPDASAERVPGDAGSLAAAREGIARLNARYGTTPDGGKRFFLYHRSRRWNARDGLWMGWERKRGKLHELNQLLRGAVDTAFLADDDGLLEVPRGVRYVVTLDADTRLPIGAVRRLAGTMAHALNRPRLDQPTRRVVEGYAILQPRVSAPLPGRRSSLFERLGSSAAGIDPYAAAVSDVYQDLFCEGSYTGKGIYDVDAFEAALDGRFSDNSVLSHDLLEGFFARAGLVSDIELFERAPANYLTSAARQHRWTRGDWQLLPWIWRRSLSPVDRWKMIDNLRRTLSMPAALLTLVIGWVWPGSSPILWTIFIVSILAVPHLLPVVTELWPRVPGISKRSHFRGVGRDARSAVAQATLTLVTMPYQAWLMSDAILRTLTRVLLTHRHLLEWTTTARTAAQAENTAARFYRRMAGGVVLACLAAAAVVSLQPSAWPVALPIVLGWMLAPGIAWWISRPATEVPVAPLSVADALALRLIARRTWGYFTTFVTADSLGLPPDNFQETPSAVVAERTSPTNIGLYLLSVVAARDFGWLGTSDTVDRLEATLTTVQGMEHHRGHLYNWHHTRDGSPMEPRYVSSVDSGNLAGALLTVANACEEMLVRPVPSAVAMTGIADAALLVREAAQGTRSGGSVRPDKFTRLEAALEVVLAVVAEGASTPMQWAERMRELDAAVRTVADWAQGAGDGDMTAPVTAVVSAVEALRGAVETHARDVDAMASWARLRVDAETAPFMTRLTPMPSLGALPGRCNGVLHEIASRDEAVGSSGSAAASTDALQAALGHAAASAVVLSHRLTQLAADARAMVAAMDFGFLFDSTRMLFAIGYRMTDATLDSGRYDLLASEANLTSLVAIAKGDAPVRHWFRLGRLLAPVGKDSILLSWSGSMFEYLMPSLIMRTPADSLLGQTCQLAVLRQISYGAERGVPWGMSESGYNVRDRAMTYQYSSFGVPGLGLRRGLGNDIVVAPYATALAAMIEPVAAAANLRALAAAGASGQYGFYESVDYTPARLPVGTSREVVRMYMAHHQAMTIVAIGNVLHGDAMRARFHAEPSVRASELLLQERTPRDVAVARPRVDVPAMGNVRELVPPHTRHFSSPYGTTPRTQFLSNGRYAVMVSAAGSGYSRWQDMAVTRWRNDATRDDSGSYILLRDVVSGERWSAGFQPSGATPEHYDVSFAEDRAEFTRRDGTLVTHLEIIVSPEDDAEVRRVSVTNYGSRIREIEVTSYAEVVLAPAASDAVHPAFSNLFIQTECVAELDTLLATRRRRAAEDAEIWLAHVLAVEGETIGDLQWETDRGAFLGRGRTVRAPLAQAGDHVLTRTVGSVLDPIVSLRRRVRVRPGQTVRLAFSTMVAPSRDAVLAMADKYHDVTTFERVATLAWSQAQIQLHHLGIGSDEAQLFQTLGGAVVYPERTLRASPDVQARRTDGVGALWAHGISGDLPIIVVAIDDAEDIGIVRQVLRAHAYWRLKRLAVDLVILNARAPSYVQDLQTLIETLVRTSQSMPRSEESGTQGKVYTLRADRLAAGQRDVLESAARVELSSRRGTLSEQVARAYRTDLGPVAARRRSATSSSAQPAPLRPRPVLEFDNGLGGFAADGAEYVTILREGAWTPAPWINVIANPEFGCLVSEAGSGCTWSMNSQENLLTPWSNDPVSDPPSEMFYLRDEDSGEVWSPTPLPIREESSEYVVRHGHGYTRFSLDVRDLALDLLQFVPSRDPVKISRLTITNHGTGPRRLSVTAYLEWVLGALRSASTPFVVTEMDPATGAMFARNSWNGDFCSRIAFADLGALQASVTGDRTEFLGRNGALECPAALGRRLPLSGRIGAGLDPCCAMQTMLEIPAGGSAIVTFLLGETTTREHARELIQRYRSDDLDARLQEVTDGWAKVLGTIQVKTPDRSLDLMLNNWLLYQTLACRIWGRTAFYQASGAWGFRDQLQDVMALAVARPEITRAQILKAASRQFVEGDVQHWWHEPVGRGVRTRISDDLLWLPYVASQYLNVTGDQALLSASIPFLEGPLLAADQTESYFEPRVAAEHGTLFEHCARAIDRSLGVGVHGLPLMGTGDWNDGMNRVGMHGKGESVWLAWFLHVVLTAWTPLATARGEATRAAAWAEHAKSLALAIEHSAWDGNWYRRAYFDDGTPLGTAGSDACAIDAIAQAWAVISAAADPGRATRAMASVDRLLVRRDDKMVLLLTPPFDQTALDPGYIKGYVPGVRENGAQYTHAAVWSVIAFAMLGDGTKAAELFGMLNPITHAKTPRGVQQYRVEPYVAVGDVCSEAPHAGRGGWSWYTGSAGWMYRAGIESMLGIRVRGAQLVIDPCIPAEWPGFTAVVRHRSARYEVTVTNPGGVCRGVASISVDDVALDDLTRIPLQDDDRTHFVEVVMAAPSTDSTGSVP